LAIAEDRKPGVPLVVEEPRYPLAVAVMHPAE
jgi:hypothetical protein